MSLSFSGNVANEIDLFTNSEIGFAIAGFAIFKILAEMPSRHVAFFYINFVNLFL